MPHDADKICHDETRFSIHSTVKLICVDPDRLDQIWPLAAPLLRAAIARTGLSAFADIEHDVLRGDGLLWLAAGGGESTPTIEAAASTRLQLTDAGKVCVITACSGKDRIRWLPLIAGIEAYARGEGCQRVRLFGRKGWLRVLDGYAEEHIVMDKELG
jgi:hypothetical protein